MPDSDLSAAQIGATVRRLRKERDLSIEALEHAADVTTLSNLELGKGNQNPTWKTLVAIAAQLEVTAVELINLAASDASKQAQDPPKT